MLVQKGFCKVEFFCVLKLIQFMNICLWYLEKY
jgi:hypothetical protein